MWLVEFESVVSKIKVSSKIIFMMSELLNSLISWSIVLTITDDFWKWKCCLVEFKEKIYLDIILNLNTKFVSTLILNLRVFKNKTVRQYNRKFYCASMNRIAGHIILTGISKRKIQNVYYAPYHLISNFITGLRANHIVGNLRRSINNYIWTTKEHQTLSFYSSFMNWCIRHIRK